MVSNNLASKYWSPKELEALGAASAGQAAPEAPATDMPSPAPTDQVGGGSVLSDTETHVDILDNMFTGEEKLRLPRWFEADLRALPEEVTEDKDLPRKWPKEVKPRISDLMWDLLILKHIGQVANQPVFVFADDFKDFFSQLKLRESSKPLSTSLLVGLLGDTSDAGQLAHVVEEVLGFGHYAASNIAQRWATAIRFMFQRRLQQAMSVFDAEHATAD